MISEALQRATLRFQHCRSVLKGSAPKRLSAHPLSLQMKARALSSLRETSRKHARRRYLVEGFVTQSAQFYEVGEAEHPVLDDEAQQLGERVQKTLRVSKRRRRQIRGQNVGRGLYKPPRAYPCCICSWDFQQTNDDPQTGIHLALMRKILNVSGLSVCGSSERLCRICRHAYFRTLFEH